MIKERNYLLEKGRAKDYFCNVVSEEVEIGLKYRLSLSINGKKEMFIQCNQSDCQYADINQYSCPLTLILFKMRLKGLAEKRKRGKCRIDSNGRDG
jgi:hypothetical protein